MGSRGAAVRALASSPEHGREDQAAPHGAQDPHHCHPARRKRQTSQVGGFCEREARKWPKTKQQSADVSGKEERFFSGGVTVDDSLQSLSHQLASDQSMPLMISNHSGTGCPTVSSTASFQLKSQTAVDRIAGINKIKLDMSTALNFRAAFESWQQERPQREGENAILSLIYLYFTSAWCMLHYNKAQIATKMSYLLTGGGSRLILKTYNRDLNK